MDNILEIYDNDGNFFFFTKENYNNHINKHPELRIPNFLDRIKKAILNPDPLYPSFLDCKDIFCFYYFEFSSGDIKRYTKVVAKCISKQRYVILSAYRPTNVKEVKYFKEPLLKLP